MDKESDKGGMYGVFFMAFTLVLVSFSCTGPIVGPIIVEAVKGGTIRPLIGMLAFSIPFALPFTLFAFFPHVLNKLPKSGGWMNSVKVTLGIIELALSLKFLSMVDQVYHLGIMDRDIFITIWIVLAVLLAVYYLGKIRLPHDSPVEKISVGRFLLAAGTLVIAVYMIPGLFGAPLRAFSGILPPITTHDFNIVQMIRGNQEGGANGLCDQPKYDDLFKLPHGLNGYFTLEEAIECAKKQNKPVFVDFTGHSCSNCRKVEENVWSNPAIRKLLEEEFVIASLYTDDRNELPVGEQYITADGKEITTIGEKNFDYQQSKFGTYSQPYYVILNPYTGNKMINTTVAFTEDEEYYRNWLLCGIKQFKNLYEEAN